MSLKAKMNFLTFLHLKYCWFTLFPDLLYIQIYSISRFTLFPGQASDSMNIYIKSVGRCLIFV